MHFSSAHLTAFRKLSSDGNPLHWNEAYAKKTPFGQIVVYGVASIFVALGTWARGRRFHLETVKAEFRRPLFAHREYELQFTEKDHQVTVLYLKGAVVQTKVVFTWKPGSSPDESENLESLKPFGLAPAQFPKSQQEALFWASRYIGMENPGERALFTDLEFKFSEKPAPRFEPTIKSTELDERFQRLTVEGDGLGVERFILNALIRPKAVEYAMNDIQREIGSSQDFTGRNILISGAARGFGSVLTRAFALHGARVVVNYRSPSRDLEALEKDLSSISAQYELLQGDWNSPSDCERMKKALQLRVEKLHLVLHNAFPHIEPKFFREQSTDEIISFVSLSLNLLTHFAEASLPLLQPKGLFVNISSVFSQTPPAQFAHYAAAKAATEGFVRGLASEYPAYRFMNLRPPRMLTDQTNVVNAGGETFQAAPIAKRVLEKMLSPQAAKNLEEWNLG